MTQEQAKDYNNLYEEIKCVGRGNFGTVFLVKNREDGSMCIAKKIALDALGEKEIEASIGEANLLKSLNHPNIVQYRHSYLEKRVLIIVMEYCECGDLATVIKKKKESGGKFAEETIMRWFVQICMALNYIHNLRILHRDIKASNVFLTSSNCVKLGDFGISKVLEGTVQAAVTVVGTPYYMSPEVCQSKPYTLKSDIWAEGCLLYELCTLSHPFGADNLLSLVYKIVKEEYDPIPACYSQELQNLVTTMLLKDSDKRPTNTEILSMAIVQKYLAAFTQLVSNPKERALAKMATVKVEDIRRGTLGGKAESKEEQKAPAKALTYKEMMKKKKEDETKRKIEELNALAKEKRVEIAEYYCIRIV